MCPSCRGKFSCSSVRKIHIDFPNNGGSSWSTCRSPRSPGLPLPRTTPHYLLLKVNATTDTSKDNDRRIHEARRLEARVLKVASQKTSVEELGADKSQGEMVRSAASSHLRPSPEPLNCPSGQSTSLDLSVLLRAVISNHSAFSEVTKVAKSAETTLRNRVENREREVHR
ncbi:hypothetical protein K488DRAFT_83183 [Vararia minispora EC-137]|uniref:Uncharacterized protein n=1 Tax=Vararia minispora EC-137 TaxID=1314806 RepID=A0ACB8QUU4_9AGAM|nr:hypothetical protein K488DRAFT_83183 [Vararia minispora EC-137]